MGLSILQWNAYSILAHGSEFKYLLDQMESVPHILCIQETFLKPEITYNLKGYSLIRKDGKNGRGGIATYIRNDVQYSKVEYLEGVDGISVHVHTTYGTIQIVNLYISPSAHFNESFLQELFDLEDIFICGDFNAKSTLWGSPKSDTRGKSLENILQKSNLVVLNTGDPTRIHRNGGSHIDLAFCSPRFAGKANWNALESNCGSDHNVIHIELQTSAKRESLYKSKWIFQKADWPMFGSLCDSYFAQIDWEDDVENVNNNITKSIIQAANETIPKSTGSGRKKQARFWNEKCSQAVKARDDAKKSLRVGSTDNHFIEYKRLKAIATKTIKSERRKSWRNFCASLSNRSNLSRVWNVIKSINNVDSTESIPSFNTDGKYAKTHVEKANVLGKYFSQVSSSANYTPQFRKHKEQFEAKNFERFRAQNNTTSVFNLPFKMSELKKSLKKCKNTAPGHDDLCYEMFRHLSLDGLEKVLLFFNRIWKEGIIPSSWKHAIVIPVLKPNKPKSEPSSYRPISLTSHFSKLMERVVVFRLKWYLEKNCYLNINQSGFRAKRNTVDQLLRLSDDILKGLGNKSVVLGVFLDVEKAYDMIWKKGVLFKLQQLGLDGNMFNWISAFLENRSLQVRIGSSVSSSYQVENGLPQGSVLSPILFLVAINDLSPPGVKYSLFADDTAIWKVGKNVNHVQQVVQNALDYITDWCNTWGFKISVVKTSFVLFHRGKRKEVHLDLNKEKIKRATSVKFLGMMFDQRLTWNEHISYLAEKCQKRINIMKLLTGSKWGSDKDTMVILYKTLIRSVLDYGSSVYFSAADSNLKRLDVIQSQALRLCCGALKCTPVEALEVECGIPPLSLRRKYLALKTAIRYTNMAVNPAKECFQDCFQLYYGKYNDHFKPLKLKVENDMANAEKAYISEVEDRIPPFAYEPILCDTGLHSKINKKSDSPHVMLAFSLEHMQKWNNSLHIYTDGSKNEHKSACAFYVPYLKYSKKFRLTDNTSVYMSEMIAILEALRFLLVKPPIRCVIFSDSFSCIQTIDSGGEMDAVSQEIRYCIYQLWCQGIPVDLCWIPSHVGIHGNEMVDSLAKEALKFESVNYANLKTIPEINKLLDNKLLEEWQNMWNCSKKGRFYHKLQPIVSHSVKYSDINKRKQTSITRLRFGKCKLADVNFMLGKLNNNLCDVCQVKEDVEHYINKCNKYNDYQVELNDKLLMCDVVPSVEVLLGNAKWYDDLWLYICQTGVKL